MSSIPAAKPPRCAKPRRASAPSGGLHDSADPADQVHEEPDPNHQRGRDHQGDEEEERNQHLHDRAGEEQEIGAQHAGDRATGADHRDEVAAIDPDVRGRGEIAAEPIEEREAPAAQAVLNVIAEHPEEQHVPDEVEPAAVEEHRGQRREEEEEAVEEIDPPAFRSPRAVIVVLSTKSWAASVPSK